MAIANSSMIRTGGIISRVATGAGLAVTGIGLLSLRAAGNFEQGMNVLQAVSGATESQMKALRTEAIALGADMKIPNVSARDAADAMVELSKGGLDVNRTLQATRGTLYLGLAANIGFADSATLVARSLQAFDLQGNQAGRVANLLAAGANKSTAEITDLALGVQNAAAQFHGLGMPIEDLVASLSIMADNALSGEYAGTALKTMLIRLTSPTDKAADVMKKYGISLFDAKGNMKGMPEIIQQFQSGLSGLTQEQREQALTTIFGVRANQAMRILMGEGADAYRKYREEITGTNAAQEMAEARTKGFNGALGAAASAVETLAIELGTAMLPTAEAAVRAFGNFIASIDPQKIIEFFSAIKDGIVWFKDFVSESEVAQYVLAALVGAITGLFIAKELIAIFKSIQIAWMLLNASFVASPIGLVVVAIAALVGALVLAYMKSEEFRAVVDKVFSWIKDNVVPIIMDVVNAIRNNWSTIVEIARTVLNTLVLIWQQTWGRLLNFVRQNLDTILAVFTAVFNNIRIVVQGVMNTILGVINVIMGVIKGDWARAWEGVKQILSGTLGTLVRLIVNTLTNLVPAVLRLAFAAGKAIVTGILNAIGDVVGWLGGKLRSGISAAVSAVAGWVVGVASAIGRAIMDGIISGVGGLAGALANKVKGAVSSALSSVGGFLGIGSPSKKTRDEIGKPMGEGIIVGFLLGTNDLPDKISDTLKDSLTKGRDAVQASQGMFRDAFSQLAQDALSAFDAITQQHRTPAEKMLDRLVSQHDAAEFKRRMQEAKADLVAAQQELAAFDAGQYGSPEEAAGELRKREEAVLAAQREVDELKYQAKKANLEKTAEKERSNYEARRNIQRRHLERELAQLVEFLMKHPEKHRQTQNKIIALLHSYGISYRDAGSVVGEAYALGLRDSMPQVVAAATEMANRVSRILRTRSPTKEGPMSDLDHWWDGFASTLVSGLDKSPVERAALGIAGAMKPSIGGGLALGASGTSTTGGASVVHHHYYVQGSLISEQDLNDRIREGINTEARRGRTISVP